MKEEKVSRNSGPESQAGSYSGEDQAGLGRELRKQREVRGWSRRELAERSGVSADTIKQIENGSSRPMVATRSKLEGALGNPLSESDQDAVPPPQENEGRRVSRRVTVTIVVDE